MSDFCSPPSDPQICDSPFATFIPFSREAGKDEIAMLSGAKDTLQGAPIVPPL